MYSSTNTLCHQIQANVSIKNIEKFSCSCVFVRFLQIHFSLCADSIPYTDSTSSVNIGLDQFPARQLSALQL